MNIAKEGRRRSSFNNSTIFASSSYSPIFFTGAAVSNLELRHFWKIEGFKDSRKKKWANIFFILLIHKESPREVYWEFQPKLIAYIGPVLRVV